MPLAWLARPPRKVVAVVALRGMIAASRVGSLSMERCEAALEAAFVGGLWTRAPDAVALAINSPGGSPVQSGALYRRVRELADRRGTKVIAFCEDVAASGGYYLACAADEIYANEASIVGSVGVASSGFGFSEALARLGVERRLFTAGPRKAQLDPFSPAQPADVARRDAMLKDVHAAFSAAVLARRGAALRRAGKLSDDAACSGEVWTGAEAARLGIVDAVGDAGPTLRRLYGQDVVIRSYGVRRSPLDVFAPSAMIREAALAIEERLAFARFMR